MHLFGRTLTLVAVCLLGGAFAAGPGRVSAADGAAPAGAAPPSADAPTHTNETNTIILQAIRLEVMNSRRLAYRIRAESGTMDEETREIRMKRPDVEIYGEDGALSQQIRGESGEVWPVDVVVRETGPEAPAGGAERTVTKYDWKLSGDVTFESVEGYRLSSDRMRFTNQDRYLSSDAGVDYRLPTGRGSLLEGSARSFRAGIDPDTGRLHSWAVMGDVVLSSVPTEPEAATDELSAPATPENPGSVTPRED